MRPLLWLATAACCALLVALGLWQWARMQEKDALFAVIAARSGEQALPASQLSEDPALEFRAIRATAVDGKGIALFGARARTFQAARLEDGRILIAETGAGGAGLKQGVEFDAVLRRFSPDAELPADEPRANRFFQPGPALAQALGAPGEGVWYLAARQLAVRTGATIANPGADPRASLPGPERHLGYALTWFGLALALVIIAALLHRRLARPTIVRP